MTSLSNLRAAALVILASVALRCEAGYRVEDVELPPSIGSREIFAVTFSPGGDLYVANRVGEIWRRDLNQTWSLFASGLHEPLGLLVDSPRVAYVMQRPELTRIEDMDGDGIADQFTTVASAWGITGNYHEFAYGLKRDREGNFLGALALDSGQEKEFARIRYSRGAADKSLVRGERHWSLVPYRGWSFKISPSGEFIPWAYGFRQAAGIGVSPDGEFFSTDNQGDWKGTSGLIHQQKGRFYGHPASLKWLPDGVPAIESDEELARQVTPLSVAMPHGSVGVSPGEPVWDTTSGRFGPFSGQVFIGDYSRLISRVLLEKVAGEYQGAAFTFFRSKTLGQGNARMAFGPDGALYLGQATWGAGEGFQRIVWDGRPAVEILSMRLTARGFALDFTTSMDSHALAKPETYKLGRFRFLYHALYGSPRIDEEALRVQSVAVSDNPRHVELVLADLKPGYIYELQLETLTSTDGALLDNPAAYYTANRLLDGTRFNGPLTKPLLDPARSAEARTIDLAAGLKTYRSLCVACHQEDGRGGGSGPLKAAANFVEDTSRLAKSDAELIRSIRLGIETTGMPPFGSVLSEQEIRNVLAYVRDAFDPLSYRKRKG